MTKSFKGFVARFLGFKIHPYQEKVIDAITAAKTPIILQSTPRGHNGFYENFRHGSDAFGTSSLPTDLNTPESQSALAELTHEAQETTQTPPTDR